MSLNHPFMGTIISLSSSIGLGLAVFWMQRCAIAHYGAHTLDGKRFRWVAPLLAVMLAAVLFRLETEWAMALTKAFFGACLITLGSIDVRFQVLPNALTLPLLALGLILSAIGLSLPLWPTLGGALTGFLLLAVPGLVYQRWKQTEGVGWGDMKLTTAIGAWLGPEAVVQVVMVASLLAALSGIVLAALRRKDWNQLLPFGPFIALAAIVWLVV